MQNALTAPAAPSSQPLSATMPLSRPADAALLRLCLRLSWDEAAVPTVWAEQVSPPNLTALRNQLFASLRPALTAEIAVHVEFLLDSYPARAGGKDAVELARANLWLAAFDGWPADLVELTCRAWMLQDRPFRPSVPGEVIAAGLPILQARRGALELVNRMLAALDRAKHEPALSNEERTAMSASMRTLAASLRASAPKYAQANASPASLRDRIAARAVGA